MRIVLFSPFEWYLGGGERYLMKMAEVLASKPNRQVSIIGSQPFEGSQYAQIAGLPSNVNFDYCPNLVSARQRYRSKLLKSSPDLFITLSNRFYPPIYPVGRRNCMVLQFPMPSSGYKKLSAVLLGYLYTPRYQNIICYSEFTAHWIKQRALPLLKPSLNIISPPILNTYYTQVTTPRQQRILAVGRFFAGEHNKKQLEMVAAFRQMVDDGLRDWELHLAGTVRPEPENQEYLRRVQNLAQDYPIFFHLNNKEGKLLGLYQSARIFWHATGLGENVNKTPEKMEHFGMTTVEAMASGLVPVVIKQGGQPEIVEHGINGFTWENTSQLINYTQSLITQPVLLDSLAVAAYQRSLQYSESIFANKIEKLFEKD